MRKEDLEPPTAGVIQLIRQRVTAKWPKLHVGILWVWSGGQRRLTFRWDDATAKHVLCKRFAPEDHRILCVMSYSGLIDEIDILQGKKKRKDADK